MTARVLIAGGVVLLAGAAIAVPNLGPVKTFSWTPGGGKVQRTVLECARPGARPGDFALIAVAEGPGSEVRVRLPWRPWRQEFRCHVRAAYAEGMSPPSEPIAFRWGFSLHDWMVWIDTL